MTLTLSTLVLGKEKTYFKILVVFAGLFWIAITISVVGLAIALVLAFFYWLIHGRFVASFKSEALKVDGAQMPKLYKTLTEVCQKLNYSPIPAIYLANGNGIVNAFTTRHAGRDFVVIYSDSLEAFGENSNEMKFLIGHELGHIIRKHVKMRAFLGPAFLIPMLGNAYLRACETTCDRFGAFASDDIEASLRAMIKLAAGKNVPSDVSPEVFASQYAEGGFFVSWHEIVSNYPTLSQRTANLIAIKHGKENPRRDRHFLAYLFGLFSIQLLILVYISIILIAALQSIGKKVKEKTQSQQSFQSQDPFGLPHGSTESLDASSQFNVNTPPLQSLSEEVSKTETEVIPSSSAVEAVEAVASPEKQ